MINACCNLYFCFIITVHGDIRRLEKSSKACIRERNVHGDIRRLESIAEMFWRERFVHGDIRHLEMKLMTLSG